MAGLAEERFRRLAFAAPDRIVVATDLTDTAYLIPHAVAQAAASQAALTLIHAVPPQDSLPAETGATPYLDPTKIDRDARQMMACLARQVRAQGFECATAVRHGFAVDVIEEIVFQTAAGRLIVGTHARHGIRKLVLGSVADQLLNRLDLPVCAVGPFARISIPRLPPRRILHPVSFNGAHRESANLAFHLAQHCKADLTLLHVRGPGRESGNAGMEAPPLESAKLAALVPCGDDLSPSVQTRISVGGIVAEVLAVADEMQADMIVVGTHARSGLRMPRGESAAYRIAASAACPVLVLREQPASQSANDLGRSLEFDVLD